MRAILLAAFCLFALPAFAEDVTIDNFTFTPAEITVKAGATVTWTNRDDIPHTVTSAAHPPIFRSPALDTNETTSVTFNTPGVYRYFCSLHAHMQGTVIVQ
jgi:amicyanin